MTERNEALEEAAKIADMFEEENFLLAHSTILVDPVLHGGPMTQANIKRSEDLMLDGCISSSRAHAARDIAAAIRALKS